MLFPPWYSREIQLRRLEGLFLLCRVLWWGWHLLKKGNVCCFNSLSSTWTFTRKYLSNKFGLNSPHFFHDILYIIYFGVKISVAFSLFLSLSLSWWVIRWTNKWTVRSSHSSLRMTNSCGETPSRYKQTHCRYIIYASKWWLFKI